MFSTHSYQLRLLLSMRWENVLTAMFFLRELLASMIATLWWECYMDISFCCLDEDNCWTLNLLHFIPTRLLFFFCLYRQHFVCLNCIKRIILLEHTADWFITECTHTDLSSLPDDGVHALHVPQHLEQHGEPPREATPQPPSVHSPGPPGTPSSTYLRSLSAYMARLNFWPFSCRSNQNRRAAPRPLRDPGTTSQTFPWSPRSDCAPLRASARSRAPCRAGPTQTSRTSSARDRRPQTVPSASGRGGWSRRQTGACSPRPSVSRSSAAVGSGSAPASHSWVSASMRVSTMEARPSTGEGSRARPAKSWRSPAERARMPWSQARERTAQVWWAQTVEWWSRTFNQSSNWLINQTINQSINQSINQWITKSLNQWNKVLLNKLTI